MLKHLLGLWGPSGREGAVASEVASLLKPHVDTVKTDRLGGLVGVKGAGDRVLVTAPLDQPGGLLTHVEGGVGRFVTLGKLAAQWYVGQRVRFADGSFGVVGTEADEPEVADLWVDLPAGAKVGDAFVLGDGSLVSVGERSAGAGIGNRAAVAVLLEVAQRLTNPAYEVHFAFTAHHLVGQRGEAVAAFGAAPAKALVVGPLACDLGKGVALVHKASDFYSNAELREQLAGLGVATQPYVGKGVGGGARVEVSQGGIPTAMLGLPVKNQGASELLDPADLEATVDLLLRFLSR